ncbi:hypothetical protein [Cytobacillus sp. BC1816]|uniref:hypothetical protein n=1 Tax=Cytobacillus sp. BC1816 TaxID=3440154 RepID=UPI003F50EF76
MSETIEISDITVELDESGDRRAYIGDFKEPVYYGMRPEHDLQQPQFLHYRKQN